MALDGEDHLTARDLRPVRYGRVALSIDRERRPIPQACVRRDMGCAMIEDRLSRMQAAAERQSSWETQLAQTPPRVLIASSGEAPNAGDFGNTDPGEYVADIGERIRAWHRVGVMPFDVHKQPSRWRL